jgi:hypothetical protein
MKAPKHWKVILTVLLVFAAGAVTGSVATTVHLKRAFERSLSVENWTNEGMKFLRKKLVLTPEQQPKIRAILQETGEQCGSSFGYAVRISGTNLVASWHRIEQELTPEQRTVYRAECQKFRDELKKGLKIDLPQQ